MNISDVIEDYRYAISEHSQETQKWYLRQLQEFAEWCALAGLELESEWSLARLRDCNSFSLQWPVERLERAIMTLVTLMTLI